MWKTYCGVAMARSSGCGGCRGRVLAGRAGRAASRSRAARVSVVGARQPAMIATERLSGSGDAVVGGDGQARPRRCRRSRCRSAGQAGGDEEVGDGAARRLRRGGGCAAGLPVRSVWPMTRTAVERHVGEHHRGGGGVGLAAGGEPGAAGVEVDLGQRRARRRRARPRGGLRGRASPSRSAASARAASMRGAAGVGAGLRRRELGRRRRSARAARASSARSAASSASRAARRASSSASVASRCAERPGRVRRASPSRAASSARERGDLGLALGERRRSRRAISASAGRAARRRRRGRSRRGAGRPGAWPARSRLPVRRSAGQRRSADRSRDEPAASARCARNNTQVPPHACPCGSPALIVGRKYRSDELLAGNGRVAAAPTPCPENATLAGAARGGNPPMRPGAACAGSAVDSRARRAVRYVGIRAPPPESASVLPDGPFATAGPAHRPARRLVRSAARRARAHHEMGAEGASGSTGSGGWSAPATR